MADSTTSLQSPPEDAAATPGQRAPALLVGTETVVRFRPNPRPHPHFRAVASRLGERRAPKLVVCRDPDLPLGVPVRVRVVDVSRASSPGRGHIEVRWLGPAADRPYADLYVEPFVRRRLEASLEAGVPVLLEGPQGCGKSSIAQEAARVLGMEFIAFNASAVQETSDFIATLQLRAEIGGGTSTIWLRTEIGHVLDRAVDQPSRRFLVFIDELNRCRELARNGIMPVLDGTRSVWDPSRAAWVVIPPNVVFAAAVNIGNGFSGTTPLDLAQVDRFCIIHLDYPPKDEETRILRERFPSVRRDVLQLVVDAADELRRDRNARIAVSMRATQEVCRTLGDARFRSADDAMVHQLIRAAICGRLHGSCHDPASDAGVASAMLDRLLVGKKPSRRANGESS